MKLINTVHAADIPVINEAVPLYGLTNLFGNVIVEVLGLAAIILFIMLIVGGFKYITSGGNPQSAESAKKTITYAIMGIVLVASAYLILQLIGTFTGADVEDFNVFKS